MQENSIIKQNILLYLENKGITPYKFYKENGVTRGILTQKNGITEENLLKFVQFAQDISLDWLLKNEGSMLKTSEKGVETASESVSNGTIEALKGIIKEQAKEIGQLEIRCETLERQLQEKVSNVYDVSIDPNVRAG